MTSKLLLVVPSVTSYETFLSPLSFAATEAGLQVYVASGPALHGCAHAPASGPTSGHLLLPDVRSGQLLAGARAIVALRRFILAVQPQVIHSHFAAAAVMTAATRYIVPRASFTWWATFHGLHSGAVHGGPGDSASRWETWAARRHDRVFVLNPEDAVYLRSLLPDVDVRVNSVALGCDLDQFTPLRFSDADKCSTKARLGIPEGAPVVVFVGRQVAFKGFATVIRAFQHIRKVVPTCRLLLVGERDRLHATGLESDEVARMNNDPAIITCGWQTDVATVLAVSDVCLFPSEREGMPVSLMEALCMGVPCVTSDSRGCRDVVRHGIDGFVLPGTSPETYAEATCRILCSLPLRQDMSRRAFDGRARFDRQAFLRDQVRQYVEATRASRHS